MRKIIFKGLARRCGLASRAPSGLPDNRTATHTNTGGQAPICTFQISKQRNIKTKVWRTGTDLYFSNIKTKVWRALKDPGLLSTHSLPRSPTTFLISKFKQHLLH